MSAERTYSESVEIVADWLCCGRTAWTLGTLHAMEKALTREQQAAYFRALAQKPYNERREFEFCAALVFADVETKIKALAAVISGDVK